METLTRIEPPTAMANQVDGAGVRAGLGADAQCSGDWVRSQTTCIVQLRPVALMALPLSAPGTKD